MSRTALVANDIDIKTESQKNLVSSINSEKDFDKSFTEDPDLITAGKILDIIFSRRCLLPFEELVTENLTKEYEPHLIKVTEAVKRNSRLNLILPGFPAKSPNRRKTLGPLPDLADKQALCNLNDLCNEIKKVYAPGAKVTICSDGRVFADLVRIPDIDVTNYATNLKEFANCSFDSGFDFFNLDHLYPEITDFDVLREELLIGFGESIYQLRRRCQDEKEAKAMYLGITRFIFEDYCGLEYFKNESRTSIQKISRSISYRVIQRSNAWTRMLEKSFPDAIRLSIHPQYRVSNKIGIRLVESDDCWLTPWHSVAIKSKGKITLCKRERAEKIGLLAFEDGRPSHFECIEGMV